MNQHKPQHHRPHHGATADTLMSLEEAAKIMGVCKQAAHQLERKALAKFRRGLITRGVRPDEVC